MFGVALAAAASAQVSEAAVKAAFVYNFTKFVTWPSAGTGPLGLCLVGETDPLFTALGGLEGKVSQGRSIQVRAAEPKAAALKSCDVIVLGGKEAGRVEAILKEARKAPALTVSEIDNFVDTGGMIGLVIVEDKVRFEINADAAQRANLQLSAQLLKLARSVKK